MAIAWVFPGQGSQKVGMADPVLSLPGAEERFSQASRLLGRDLLAICRGEELNGTGPTDLNDTRNTQPALFVVESLIVDELRRQGREPALVAGHSLGELVALYAAGVFDAEIGLELMLKRSTLMASAGGGAMSAVIGFDRDQLTSLVAAEDGVVIANDNSAAQVVLSGTPEAVKAVTDQLSCKRAIPLPVSGAFHSPFMAEAAQGFSEALDAIAFEDARVPVLSNTDPSPTCDATVIKQRLRDQMTTGVRWRETMETMTTHAVDTLVEIGPGNVLSGLAKRSLSGVVTSQLAGADDLGL
ncbi:ACP S-malonyltransferase [Synechococcus sp. UW105]|jgi:[acyl-carrier-protein] S-malonyltransferase|uniref:ACP S-malonyltransferase n=1 Tax=unclassified Synechococcus TaxID=2626047 RepID=UPI000E0E7BC0|nr:ACP S-malonyltransferase [Synechococcus sp. UW105]RZO14719.1 MAG: [acyl-carrier-protein] S-malonyltransferase [Synechococcus sp. MED-G135]|tara:strand:- start:376 stop:1272 length:897 start_codon:yes stop_codon:yes gene_type:complete